MKVEHPLGPYRALICSGISLLLFCLSLVGLLIQILSGDCGFSQFFKDLGQIIVMTAVCWGVAWYSTIDKHLKFTVPGFIVLVPFLIYITLIMAIEWVFGISSDAFAILGITGMAVGVVVWILLYLAVFRKSSWVGDPCPHCGERGKTNIDEINREFLRQIYVSNNKGGMELNNVYKVTWRNSCASCNAEWISQDSEVKCRI